MKKISSLEKSEIIDEELIEAGAVVKKYENKNTFVYWVRRRRKVLVGLGAIFLLLLTVRQLYICKSSDFILEHSSGAVVKYTNNVPSLEVSNDLVPFTEKQIFNDFNTVIIKGSIEKIKNIKVTLDSYTDYRSIISVKVEQVYRGDVQENSVVDILCPIAISTKEMVEDSDVMSCIKEGMTGIFMPLIHDNDFCEEGGKGGKLYLSEIAQYGLMDAQRFAFLETLDGLIYDKDTFKTVKEEATLEDIESYIESEIK